jgi:hypothetical protein
VQRKLSIAITHHHGIRVHVDEETNHRQWGVTVIIPSIMKHHVKESLTRQFSLLGKQVMMLRSKPCKEKKHFIFRERVDARVKNDKPVSFRPQDVPVSPVGVGEPRHHVHGAALRAKIGEELLYEQVPALLLTFDIWIVHGLDRLFIVGAGARGLAKAWGSSLLAADLRRPDEPEELEEVRFHFASSPLPQIGKIFDESGGLLLEEAEGDWRLRGGGGGARERLRSLEEHVEAHEGALDHSLYVYRKELEDVAE